MNWQREFEHCIDKRWLVRMPEARYLVTKELEVAQNKILGGWRASQAGLPGVDGSRTGPAGRQRTVAGRDRGIDRIARCSRIARARKPRYA